MSDRGRLTTLLAPRPATRIGRTVVLPSGAVIQLSRIQRVLFALGLRTHLSAQGRPSTPDGFNDAA